MGHTYTNLQYHVIFSTKDRRPLIIEPVRQRLYEYMSGVAGKEFGKAMIIGGTDNHVHGLIVVKPSVSLSDAMCKWKSLTSGWAAKTLGLDLPIRWQTGYAAFSVSASMKGKVVRYIQGQEAHHRKQTFKEELIEFLERHEVEYDPDEVWA